MSDKKRVVVTGLGVVSCFGNEVDPFYEALLTGKSGVKKIEKMPVEEYAVQIGGEITDFEVGDYMDPKMARRMDPFIHYAMVAGKKALEYGGIDIETLDKSRCGILVGSGMGGMESFSAGVETLITKGYKRISPFFIPSIITNMAGGMLAIDLGFTGPNYSVSTACATGNHAIIAALKHIRAGDADLMLCGGCEAPITPIGLTPFITCKALTRETDPPEKASRPWDTERSGFVMGEGAGVLVLESLEHAKKRGARIYAEVVGGAIGCDAYHMTDPRPDGSGAATIIGKALADGHVSVEDVGYVNAHATSTKVGDSAEIAALRKALGSQISNVKMNATKSMTGHCLGAAAAIEAIVTVKACMTGRVHPTLNCENPDPCVEGINCCTDPSAVGGLEWQGDLALSNSFGFGGHNSCVIFRRWKP